MTPENPPTLPPNSICPSLGAWVTHSMHGLLVEGEGDVGVAVVLVTGAGVALAGRRGRVGAPALAQALAGLDEAVALPDRDAALARGTAAATFGARLAGRGAAPHLQGGRKGRDEVQQQL